MPGGILSRQIDVYKRQEQCRKNILDAVKRVDSGNGVAILTDMFGGTPSNLAISVMSQPKVEVLAGINLPMLIKLAKVRETCPLEQAVDVYKRQRSTRLD